MLLLASQFAFAALAEVTSDYRHAGWREVEGRVVSVEDESRTALYLRDPDGNGIELYWDRPPAEWPRTAEGELAMDTRRLDLDDLLRHTDAEAT